MGEIVFLALIGLHVLAATIWVGGALFFLLAVVPATRAAPDSRIAFFVGRAFRPVAWAALGTLVLTGPLLLWDQGIGLSVLGRKLFWLQAFGLTLALKLALVVAVLGLTFWHDRSSRPGTGRSPQGWATRALGAVIGLLSIVILLAGLLLAQGL